MRKLNPREAWGVFTVKGCSTASASSVSLDFKSIVASWWLQQGPACVFWGAIWGIWAIFGPSTTYLCGSGRDQKVLSVPLRKLCILLPLALWSLAVFRIQEGGANVKPSSLTWSRAGVSQLLSILGAYSLYLSSSPWLKWSFSNSGMASLSRLLQDSHQLLQSLVPAYISSFHSHTPMLISNTLVFIW
jgi:hypothetical protein